MKNKVWILPLLLIIHIIFCGNVYANSEIKSGNVTFDQEAIFKSKFEEKISTQKQDNTNMILMHKKGMQWEASVGISNLCESWYNSDKIAPVEIYQISVDRDASGEIIFTASADTYTTGDTAIITIRNDTQKDTLDIPVNFTSQKSIPTFPSWEQAYQFVGSISRHSFTIDDVYIDTSMRLDVVLEKETIDTLETIVRNRLEAYQNYCAGGGAVVEECGKVDNSDSFFPLVRSKGFWVTSISLQDINQNWERNDNIYCRKDYRNDETKTGLPYTIPMGFDEHDVILQTGRIFTGTYAVFFSEDYSRHRTYIGRC